MHPVDVIALALLALASAAFAIGASFVADSADLSAMFWIAVGATSAGAATRFAKGR
jgi:hypothetical protein